MHLASLKRDPNTLLRFIFVGDIAKRCNTIVMFLGIMISTRYVKILKAWLVPFIQEAYPEGHRFQQEYDKKHCSR